MSYLERLLRCYCNGEKDLWYLFASYIKRKVLKLIEENKLFLYWSLPFYPELVGYTSSCLLTRADRRWSLLLVTVVVDCVNNFQFNFIYSRLSCSTGYYSAAVVYDSKRNIGFLELFFYRKYYLFRRRFDLKAKVRKIAMWTNFIFKREKIFDHALRAVNDVLT